MGIAGLSDTEQMLLNEVSEHNLMDFTAKVASEVRLSGSAEEYRSFEYSKCLMDLASPPSCWNVMPISACREKQLLR
ncbi:hypothetical protein [Paenibacillus alginolyticus]|uniref:hypothetical protein n=1 Tax=Paenibacillus alginolyticus TaxID=59839 RepID=UPI001FE4E8C7|nr:hypothetical protein [Paenibacillus frigoriresistens]